MVWRVSQGHLRHGALERRERRGVEVLEASRFAISGRAAPARSVRTPSYFAMAVWSAASRAAFTPAATSLNSRDGPPRSRASSASAKSASTLPDGSRSRTRSTKRPSAAEKPHLRIVST